ncbi:hypothetical protein ACQ859_10880 [Roseateles chitinivorans]|uniref:hypothetical protein n=1 Tax=Roseateles chitinivorans TaxID=2917965 RepID=UPI003D672505
MSSAFMLVKASLILASLLIWEGASAVTLESIDIVAPSTVSTEEVRAVTRLIRGKDYGDETIQFKAACDAVREFRPLSRVRCSLVTRSENRATFGVEVLDKPYIPSGERPSCRAISVNDRDSPLWKEYVDFEEFRRSQYEESTDSRVGNEFVNSEMELDYQFPPMHERMKMLSSRIRSNEGELFSWLSSCDVSRKSAGLDLLSYLGDASTAARFALAESVSGSPEVRNSALRLLSTFASALNARQRLDAAKIACEGLENGGFLDVNKSLGLIEALESLELQKGVSLAASCVERISQFARESTSPQLGGFARSVVDLRKRKINGPGSRD